MAFIRIPEYAKSDILPDLKDGASLPFGGSPPLRASQTSHLGSLERQFHR